MTRKLKPKWELRSTYRVHQGVSVSKDPIVLVTEALALIARRKDKFAALMEMKHLRSMIDSWVEVGELEVYQEEQKQKERRKP